MSKFDIVLTVHNKDDMVGDVIDSIFEKTTGEYELFIVLDGCTDKSEEIVREKVNGKPNCHVLHEDNVFETKANNAGIRAGKSPYIIIVQDDMVILEDKWNERMLEPFTAFDDVFAVTSKAAHGLTVNAHSNYYRYGRDFRSLGWSDLLNYTDVANRHNTPRNIFAVRGSVNRGPLMLDREKLEVLGLFDEEFAPQNMDDHELCTRARKEHNWVCGLYWIDFLDDPENATTKTHDPNRTPKWLYEAQTKNTWTIYDRHGVFLSTINSPKEERKMK